ncbi:hypothetical protein LINPERHAP2_LOCUS40978 [Linum perenne]
MLRTLNQTYTDHRYHNTYLKQVHMQLCNHITHSLASLLTIEPYSSIYVSEYGLNTLYVFVSKYSLNTYTYTVLTYVMNYLYVYVFKVSCTYTIPEYLVRIQDQLYEPNNLRIDPVPNFNPFNLIIYRTC